MQDTLNRINDFLKNHQWCDFEIIELKGNIKIGGNTGFGDGYDIIITFTDVFFMQLLYQWKTDTSKPSFEIPDIEEQRTVNMNFAIEQGYQLFKISAEDIRIPMYISAANIAVEFLNQ